MFNDAEQCVEIEWMRSAKGRLDGKGWEWMGREGGGWMGRDEKGRGEGEEALIFTATHPNHASSSPCPGCACPRHLQRSDDTTLGLTFGA